MRRLLTLVISGAVLLAACGPSAATPIPQATATPAATATAAPTDTPAATPTPTAAVTATPAPTDAPTPTPVVTAAPAACLSGPGCALGVMQTYIGYQTKSNFVAAWAMLSAWQQSVFGSEASFATTQKAFLPTMKKGASLTANPKGYMSLADWIAGQPYESSIHKATAQLVLVEWVALQGNNAGWEMWVVNPIAGGWELYQVR
jgi:hypothetical protein